MAKVVTIMSRHASNGADLNSITEKGQPRGTLILRLNDPISCEAAALYSQLAERSDPQFAADVRAAVDRCGASAPGGRPLAGEAA